MKNFYETVVLHGDGSTGGKKQWQGFAALDDLGHAVTYTKFGKVGGTIQTSKPTLVIPTNVGRANEREPKEQAISEIESQCLRKQKKDGYLPVGVQASAAVLQHQTRTLPMLAPSELYPKFASDLRWPLFGQPKLDGMRLVTDGVDFWSRTGALQNDENIEHLRQDTHGLLIDGEVMLPPDIGGFQDTMSAMKDARHPLRSKLVYCVFDVVELSLPFEQRFKLLETFMAARPHPNWVLVTTVELANDAEARAFQTACLGQGVEGCMLRNKRGMYKVGGRSRDLQKFKEVDDDEFTIVGYKEATGGWAGTPVWKLLIGADNVAKPAHDGSVPQVGVVFEAKPKTSLKLAQDMWKARDSYIGKRATVLFQGYYDVKPNDLDSGKPRFPRFKAVREAE